MIFILPLTRNGYYYMSHRTFKELSESEEAEKFNKILKALDARVVKIPNYFLIKLPIQYIPQVDIHDIADYADTEELTEALEVTRSI